MCIIHLHIDFWAQSSLMGLIRFCSAKKFEMAKEKNIKKLANEMAELNGDTVCPTPVFVFSFPFIDDVSTVGAAPSCVVCVVALRLPFL